ncbi:hypothetical protein BAE44_0010549 [Dichanthelium oligosanthes]|uniref:MATH domain-containing protein n=1 Tax=Dichanthelium oligosanthes TaxID=888268 RepID=A0A1E5VTI2_9POAL|nr:hypothetical protein BAE44_0010549 [Dichanthelium oligosanthes]
MSLAAAGELLRSTFSIVPDTTRGYHILKIDGYSLTKGTPTGESLNSHPFTLGGHRWYILYYPNGHTSEFKDYVSIFLHLMEGTTQVVKAQCPIRLVTEVAERALTSEIVRSFDSLKGWEYSQFIKRTELEELEHLKDDSFTRRCNLFIINEFRAGEEKAEVATRAFVSMPPSDLCRHLGDLLLAERGADVVFEVGGKTFVAHR